MRLEHLFRPCIVTSQSAHQHVCAPPITLIPHPSPPCPPSHFVPHLTCNMHIMLHHNHKQTTS